MSAALQPPVIQQPTPKPRHVPERSCVACRRKAPQAELLRLSRPAQVGGQLGSWQLDTTSNRSGRGVYLCNNTECWNEKRLKRTFGAQASRVGEMLQQYTQKEQ